MSLTLTGHCLHQTDTLVSGLGMIYLDHKVFYLNKLSTFKNQEILPPNPYFQLFLKNYKDMIILAIILITTIHWRWWLSYLYETYSPIQHTHIHIVCLLTGLLHSLTLLALSSVNISMPPHTVLDSLVIVFRLDNGPKAALALQRKSDNYLSSRRCCKDCRLGQAQKETENTYLYQKSLSILQLRQPFFVDQYFLKLNYFSQKDILPKPRKVPPLKSKTQFRKQIHFTFCCYIFKVYLQAIVIKTRR